MSAACQEAARRIVEASENPMAPLVALVGPSRARHMMFTRIDAEEHLGRIDADEAREQRARIDELIAAFGKGGRA